MKMVLHLKKIEFRQCLHRLIKYLRSFIATISNIFISIIKSAKNLDNKF